MWQTVPALRARAVVHGKPYRLDKVFGADTSTAEIHSDQVAAIVRHVVRGFNGCVLAYGQTCSGKTTTIRGPSDGAAGGGLIAMSVIQLLEAIEIDEEPGRWTLGLSYIEIYNETVGDLLSGRDGLALTDGTDGGVEVRGLEQVRITDWKQAEAALRWGERHRHVSATLRNERSSRAHVVCRLRLARAATEADPNACTSELNIVDLAGSERVSPHSRGLQDAHARGVEGGHINKSLLVLSTVIQKLVDAGSTAAPGGNTRSGSTPRTGGAARSLGGGSGGGGGGVRTSRGRGDGPTVELDILRTPAARGGSRGGASASGTGRRSRGGGGGGGSGAPHVPFRSSKITRLLQGSLAGGAVSLIICHVAPASDHVDETHNTLRFALRARRLTLQPVSAPLVPDHAMRMRAYESELASSRREIDLLKAQIARQEAAAMRAAALGGIATTHSGGGGGDGGDGGAEGASDAGSGHEAAEGGIGEEHDEAAGAAAGGAACGMRPLRLSTSLLVASPIPSESAAAVPAASAPSSAFHLPPAAAALSLVSSSDAPSEVSVASPRLAALLSSRRASRDDDRLRSLTETEGALAASRAALARMEAQVVELQDRLDAEAAARRASERVAEAAMERAAASEVEAHAMHAEVATLAAAAREVASFEREEAQLARDGRESDRREESEREATLRFQLTEEVLALQQQQEAALQRVLDAREAAFERERESLKREAEAECAELSAARRRAETRLAELEEALGRARRPDGARRQSDAALAAEAEALSLAYDLARGSEGAAGGRRRGDAGDAAGGAPPGGLLSCFRKCCAPPRQGYQLA